MEDRLAMITIIVEDNSSWVIGRINDLLHEYRDIVVGRMGLPYPKRQVSLISLAVDGEENKINALSGKLGMIGEVRTHTTMARTKI